MKIKDASDTIVKPMEYEEYYQNYWENEFSKREESNYFPERYDQHIQFLRPGSDGPILDIGGGNGHLMHYLKLKNATILDISDSGLEFAKTKLKLKVKKGNLQERFPVRKNSFQTAYAFEVLEHLHFGNKCLCEIHEALKENGTLYISQPTIAPDGVHHVRQYFLKDLKTDLPKCGFDIIEVRFVSILAYRTRFKKWMKNNSIKHPLFFAGLLLSILSRIPKPIQHFICTGIPNSRFVSLTLVKARKKMPTQI